ncbi:TATA-binding protein interacting (TIP20) [Rhizoctonia solani]|uniref:TATA-binding protein interacting (TIP20) n=1 Tax=Rhizoctonia solani TaxID=456999 RepID=A0A8H7IM23_9AGAM|nr:TATA-binding protein interacting (TIP20) [Rhizoctonia solani]
MRIEKMQSPDSDLRFMALNDLANDLSKNQLGNQDEQSEAKLTRQVVSLLAIRIVKSRIRLSSGESHLGQLIKVVRPAQMDSTIDQLIEYSGGKDDELRDIAGLGTSPLSAHLTAMNNLQIALKTVTAELPLEGTVAPRTIQKLVPKLLQQLGSRACTHTLQSELQQFISSTVLPGLQPSAPLEKQRTTIHLVAAVARHLASSLNEVVPSVLKGVNKEDEELREAGLQALELLTLRCDEDEDDEPMEDQDDDDDEDGGEYSDDEDTSYKIRRSATKLLAAIITTKPVLAEELYGNVAPVLVSRFADREPTVRYEVWTALTLLIRQPSPALDTLAPKFLKQLLKTLPPKTAPPQTSWGTEEQLFKVLVHPEALPTFSLLVKHAVPSEDVKQKLVSLMHERHPRVAADAIKAGTELVQRSQDPKFASSLQSEARERLKNSSTDAAVRAVCARAIGALLVAKVPYEDEDWELVRRSGAVGVVTGVLKEIKEKELEIILEKAWLDANIVWTADLVRRGAEVPRSRLLGVWRLCWQRGEIPESVQTPLIENLKTYISQSDPQLLIKSLELLTFLLRNWPKQWFASIENQVLPRIYPLATETLLPASLDALRGFLYALANADEQIASHLVGGLKVAYEKSGTGAANVSKCLGAVVRAQRPIAAGTINEFAKHIKPTTKASQTSLILCLLTVGEIGRFIDMSNQPEVFDNSLGFFKSDAEEIRNAAAFAVGNIAIGSQERFLPVIVKLVQTDDEKRLLSMNALKEVVSHCSQAHLESIAESLWQPLFDTGSSHEKALNIAASCLGKLTTTNPARHMFGFGGVNGLDELLKPFVVVFLGLLDDKDLNVKRLALAALNQAARNKPRLIEDQLPSLLPKLYDETTPKPELIRIMEMGPWRHKIDDGLEARRTAYETMYTLLDTSLSKLGLDEFLTIVLRGLSDESNEVKVLCHMMLHRLSQVAPSATSQRLDETVEPLRAAMKEVTMDKNTVKQDLEQAAELQRSALRAAAALNTLSHPGAPKFVAFVESLEKGKLASEFREQKA